MKLAMCAALATAALSLGGCMHVTPEQATGMIRAFADAGCKGQVHAALGGATGQLGGGAHAEASVDGACDPAAARPEIKNGDPTF